MKSILVFLLNIFYVNLVFSGTYKVEAYMDTTISGDTKLPDNRTYRTFSLDGMWTVSYTHLTLPTICSV